MRRVRLGGFDVLFESEEVVLRIFSDAISSSKKICVFFANTNFVVKCQRLRGEMNRESVVILNDGIGVDLASWFFCGERFPSNLNGTDLLPKVLDANPGVRVFLIGGRPGVAQRAAVRLANEYGADVVGCCDGFGEFQQGSSSLVKKIDDAGAQVVLVAMGNPIQEEWIMQASTMLRSGLIFGVGALFDFLVGDATRAPLWVRRLRLEWLYRLCHEPKRLLKRYTIDIFKFLYVCADRARQR